jgi:hypothetical protein
MRVAQRHRGACLLRKSFNILFACGVVRARKDAYAHTSIARAHALAEARYCLHVWREESAAARLATRFRCTALAQAALGAFRLALADGAQ